jgi:hypothetical protein
MQKKCRQICKKYVNKYVTNMQNMQNMQISMLKICTKYAKNMLEIC